MTDLIAHYDSQATTCGCSTGSLAGVPSVSVVRRETPVDAKITCLACGVSWLELRGHGPSDAPPSVRPRALGSEERAA